MLDYFLIFTFHYAAAWITSWASLLFPNIPNVYVLLFIVYIIFASISMGASILCISLLKKGKVTVQILALSHIIAFLLFLYVYGRNPDFLFQENDPVTSSKWIDKIKRSKNIMQYSKSKPAQRCRNADGIIVTCDNGETRKKVNVVSPTVIKTSMCLFMISLVVRSLILAFTFF